MAIETNQQGLERPGGAQYGVGDTETPQPIYSSGESIQSALSYDSSAQGMAQALGWLSIGLGVGGLFAPRQMGRLSGLGEERTTLLRAVGARELLTGIGILSQPRAASWLQARVAGDLMDLAASGYAGSAGAKPTASAGAAFDRHCRGNHRIDATTATKLQRGRRVSPARTAEGALPVEKSVTIGKSPEECYHFWHAARQSSALHAAPRIGDCDRRSPLALGCCAPGNTQVEWDAQIPEDRPRSVCWRSWKTRRFRTPAGCASSSARAAAAPS